jgi:hypothetical protein
VPERVSVDPEIPRCEQSVEPRERWMRSGNHEPRILAVQWYGDRVAAPTVDGRRDHGAVTPVHDQKTHEVRRCGCADGTCQSSRRIHVTELDQDADAPLGPAGHQLCPGFADGLEAQQGRCFTR